jgi:hypothetical protein
MAAGPGIGVKGLPGPAKPLANDDYSITLMTPSTIEGVIT